MKRAKTLAAAFAMTAMVALPIQQAKAEPVLLIVGGVALVGVAGYLLGHHACHGCNAGPSYVPMKYQGEQSYGTGETGVKLCAMKFKSFNPDTGMVKTANGTKPCPYLQ